MGFVHDVLVEESAELLESVDHVIDLDAVYELGIVPELGLDSIKLGV